MQPLIYDHANRELRTVCDYFVGRAVHSFSFCVHEGQPIESGTPIAHVRFSGCTETETIVSPEGCSGVVRNLRAPNMLKLSCEPITLAWLDGGHPIV